MFTHYLPVVLWIVLAYARPQFNVSYQMRFPLLTLTAPSLLFLSAHSTYFLCVFLKLYFCDLLFNLAVLGPGSSVSKVLTAQAWGSVRGSPAPNNAGCSSLCLKYRAGEPKRCRSLCLVGWLVLLDWWAPASICEPVSKNKIATEKKTPNVNFLPPYLPTHTWNTHTKTNNKSMKENWLFPLAPEGRGQAGLIQG